MTFLFNVHKMRHCIKLLILSVQISQGETAFARVLGEAAGLSELFVAAAALKLPLAGVDGHVLVQLGVDGKAARTEVALEPQRPLTAPLPHLNRKMWQKNYKQSQKRASKNMAVSSVADPGSGAFLTPGSGISKKSGCGIRN
jgi:hypothetical protein